MFYGVCSCGKEHVRFDIDPDKESRKITVRISGRVLGAHVEKIYPAEQFGDALDEYDRICAEIENRDEEKKK